MFKAYLLACMQNASGVFLDQWVSDILGRGRGQGVRWERAWRETVYPEARLYIMGCSRLL